jgi:N-acetylglucosamine repressor
MKSAGTKRERDKAVILAVAKRLGPLSRVAIHRLTQLRANTISTLTRELLSEGRLLEAGLSDNPVGRKQVLLQLNHERGCMLAVEFDADVVIAVAMDLHPRILSVVREATVLDGGVEGLVRQLFRCARQAVVDAHVGDRPLLGIGLADPGVVDRQRGVSVMSSQIDFWRDVPLAKRFEAEFGVETTVESATRSKTVAERVLGAGRMADDMIYVEYRAGIGAGIITGGRLLTGATASAGEFGHTHVVAGGPPCQCGSFGCLEAVAGPSALAARFRKVVLDGGQSLGLELAHGNLDEITGRTVLEASQAGDKTCATLVEEMGRHLGLGLANLVNLFNPALIVLDQRLELAGPALLDQLLRTVRLQALRHAVEGLEIRVGKLGDEAGVLGIGLIMLEHLFEIPALKPPQFLMDPDSAKAFRSAGARSPAGSDSRACSTGGLAGCAAL